MNGPSGDAAGRSRSFTVDGHVIAARQLKPALYIVATPIGNLADVTLRGLGVLAAADLVACEDTRVSAVLLRHYGISARLVAYHDHNAETQRPKLLEALADGQAVALISDAGTPLVSDPGYRLVVEARAAGHDVVPIPGASSVLAALVVSGLPSDRFLFAGFLPPKHAARMNRLNELARVPATLIFFETGPRLAAALGDMAAAFGARQATVARELTKTFETVVSGSLGELVAEFADKPPKGEIVITVGPPVTEIVSAADADRVLVELLREKSVSEAAGEAAAMTGLKRNDLYRRALALKAAADDGDE